MESILYSADTQVLPRRNTSTLQGTSEKRQCQVCVDRRPIGLSLQEKNSRGLVFLTSPCHEKEEDPNLDISDSEDILNVIH